MEVFNLQGLIYFLLVQCLDSLMTILLSLYFLKISFKDIYNSGAMLIMTTLTLASITHLTENLIEANMMVKLFLLAVYAWGINCSLEEHLHIPKYLMAVFKSVMVLGFIECLILIPYTAIYNFNWNDKDIYSLLYIALPVKLVQLIIILLLLEAKKETTC